MSWFSVLRATCAEITADRVLAVGAGVTFYALLGIFPALTAFVSFYGLFADRATAAAHVANLAGVLPGDAVAFIGDQMQRIAGGSETGLGIAAAASLALAMWSANAGTKAMIEALNIAYDVEESRSFIVLNAQSLVFTAGVLTTVLILIGAVAVIPAVLQLIVVGSVADWLLWAGRWPFVVSVLLIGLAVLYRYGPDRPAVKWRWITPGSAVATLALLAFSMLFSWYAANFGNYNETYGSLSAVIVFLTWLWVSSVIVICGAELNAEVERAASTTIAATPAKAQLP